MMNELLQQVRVIDPVSGTDQIADILIADGYIQAVETEISDLSADTTVRDCRGFVVGPGLVDLYSHSGEPGFEERETLASLVDAAAAGGFTRLAILPDTLPVLDNLGGLAYLQQAKIQHPKSKIEFWGALTVGIQGQQMTSLAEMAAAGVVGFADGQPVQNLALLRRLLEYLQPLGKPVALWPCDRALSGNGVMREGSASIRFGLPGNPAIAETSALAALLEVVEATRTPVHIMRVSTARSVELIANAKARNLPIAASTTWMHLLHNTEAVGSYDSNLRLEPPLGNSSDQAALIQGIQSGVLDAIAIDHTPYTYEEKTVAFSEAPAGAIGLELALSLLWHTFVATGDWSALELWRVLSTHPAECLQQKPPAIAPGQPAELVLFDPQLSWTADRQTLKSRSENTPWLGRLLTGRVLQTWVMGN
ncbi:dihydroorotase [Coleofasciculus sp. FACHB-712]|uniref:dihydroorotase n=1 Tax=Coleofasciculus sp. FACHB-712 TaxID=2692789 RepID=UPI0016893C87|nr:dihydroorotase [Coleofasciculus sp. FACHB-712]